MLERNIGYTQVGITPDVENEEMQHGEHEGIDLRRFEQQTLHPDLLSNLKNARRKTASYKRRMPEENQQVTKEECEKKNSTKSVTLLLYYCGRNKETKFRRDGFVLQAKKANELSIISTDDARNILAVTVDEHLQTPGHPSTS